MRLALTLATLLAVSSASAQNYAAPGPPPDPFATLADQPATHSGVTFDRNMMQIAQLAPGAPAQQNGASANVVNLQKRVAGVLPVAIDVPRTGTSFSFVRPLVLDEETKVTFSYKSR